MTKGRGGGKTPGRVVELLVKEVKGTSQSAVARATGLTQSAVHRYMKGIGEPSQATLEKLSDYFGVSVAELRGENELITVEFNTDEMKAIFGKAAVTITTSKDILMQVGISIVLAIQQGLSDALILNEINGWRKKLAEIDAKKNKDSVNHSGLIDKLNVNPADVLKRMDKLGIQTKKEDLSGHN